MRCPACGGRSKIAAACRDHALVDTPVPVAAVAVAGYTILGTLGSGGFGSVVRARRADGQVVALKIAHADADARARLGREHALLTQIGPPWVPRVFDYRDDVLAMELVATPTLAQRMTELPPLAAAALATLVEPLLATIAELHRRDIVHRDLKPENIFLDDTCAIVVDFGLARGALDAALTAGTLGAGTAVYTAPEQLAGTTSTSTDLYALGVILFELATGRPPFWGSDAELRLAHQLHRPPLASEFAATPPLLDAAIAACLAKDPARRPALDELRARLREAAASSAERASAIATRATRTQITCAVLLFEGTGTPTAIADAIRHQGGELVGFVDGVWAAVFSPADGPRPLARARAAAANLLDASLATRAVVDTRDITMRLRADGTRQLLTRLHDRSLAAIPPGTIGGVADTHASPDEVPLVGRERLLAELDQRARAAHAAVRSECVVIVGAPGVGRSRLGHELAARLRDLRVVQLSLRDAAGGSLAGYRLVARELAGTSDVSGLSDVRDEPDTRAAHDRERSHAVRNEAGSDASDVSRNPGPETRANVADNRTSSPQSGASAAGRRTAGIDPRPAVVATPEDRAAFDHALGRSPDGAMIERLRATPGAYRIALERALAAAIAAATTQPTIAIIDDAELADPASLGALRLVGDGLGVPVWICLLATRPLAELPAIELPPLGATDAAALTRALLRPVVDVPAPAIEKLVDRAAGKPAALAAACRVLHAVGAIRPRERGGDWYLDTDALDVQLGDREPALEPGLRDVAAALALLAPGFTHDDAIAILGRLPRAAFPLDPGVAIERLRQRGIVDGDERVRSVSEAARAALALPADSARLVHAAAAAHYADDPARLVPHVAATGDRERAGRLLVEQAERARDVHDYFGAEALFGRALELIEDLAARRGRAAMRYRLGRYEDAVADYARARELAGGDRALAAELLLDEAMALDWMYELPRSAERVHQARALVDDASPTLHMRLLVAEGRSAWRRDDVREAIELLERAVAHAEPLGDSVYEDRIAALAMLVFVLPSVGRVDDAERLAADAIAICEHRGDRLHLIALLFNRMTVWLARRQPERAIADLERSAELGRELGLPSQRYRALLGLADIERRIGELAAAQRHAELARAIELHGSAAGAQQVAALALLHLAVHLDPAAARATTITDDAVQFGGANELAAIRLALADAGDAAWRELLGRVAAEEPEILADCHELRALAASRGNRPIDARAHLEAALAAARVHDPIAVARLERALATQA